jgi:hypothetical protein
MTYTISKLLKEKAIVLESDDKFMRRQVRRVINDEVNKAAPNFRAGERAILVIRQQLSYGEVTTWRVELGLRPLMGLEEIKEEMYQQWEEMYERQKTYIIEEEPV